MSEEHSPSEKLDLPDLDEKDALVLRVADAPQQKSKDGQDKTRITKNKMDALSVEALQADAHSNDPPAAALPRATITGGSPQVKTESTDENLNATKEHIGTIIAGRYRVLALLGVGGMGSVLKAEHIMLGTLVAIKILNRDLATNQTALKRFAQEAKAASSLRHTNIASVSDYGLTESGFPYFVMDLMVGKSLAEIIDENGSLPWEKVVEFGIQISDAMAYAHFQGIVHRDLKPANIMISQLSNGDERATVVDFGIAKLANEALDAQKITQTGEVFGSPLYMSPEQCTGKPLDGRSDVYSFGCLMFEMVTGKVPFLGTNAVATILMQINDPPPSLRTTQNQRTTISAPIGLETVIMHCLGKEPGDRYSSMDAVKADLQLVKRGLSPTKKSVKRFRLRMKAPGLFQTGLVTTIGTIGVFLGMAFWINKWQYEMIPWQRDFLAAKHDYERAEYAQALMSAKHGIKVAVAKKASKHEIAALYNILGDSYKATANGKNNALNDAKTAYEQAIAAATDKDSDRQKVQAYLNLGDVAKTLGDNEAALTNYDLALSSFTERYVDNAQKARLLVRKGVAYHDLKKFDDAYKQLQAAVAMYKSIDDVNTPALIDALQRLSDSLTASGEPVFAKQYLDEAKSLRESFQK